MVRASSFLLAIGLSGSWSLGALLTETFDTDPIAGGRAVVVNDAPSSSRFTHSSGDGTLTAAYDTLLPTVKLRWTLPGGVTLTEADSFGFDARFRIHSAGFFADPFGFAQIAFGLENAVTTGLDRTGTFADAFSDDTFDVVSVDYFPNLSDFFATPNIQPNIFGSDDGDPDTDAFAAFYTPTSPDSSLEGPGESDLARDVYLTASLTYDAATRAVALRLLDAGGAAILINAEGGPDGLTDTIDFILPGGAAFEVDAFSLLLWHDGWTFGESSVRGDVTFDSFSVYLVPEPATAALLLASLLLAPRRRAVHRPVPRLFLSSN